MSSDPFAHGMPAGDFHTWVRPQGPECPDCECCTAALCQKALSHRSPCSMYVGAGPSLDVSMCPCSTRLREFRPPSEGAKYCATYGGVLGVGETPEEARADLLGRLTEDQRTNALKDHQGS